MNLFTQLSPRAQELINQYPDMINDHIEEWVDMQLKIKGGIAGDVIRCLALAKRRKNPSQGPLKLTPDRRRMIEKLVKLGNRMEQFEGVITYKVETWWGTDWEKYLTPETLFAATNFQKYLEEARENYYKVMPAMKKNEEKNQYDALLNR